MAATKSRTHPSSTSEGQWWLMVVRLHPVVGGWLGVVQGAPPPPLQARQNLLGACCMQGKYLRCEAAPAGCASNRAQHGWTGQCHAGMPAWRGRPG